MKYIKTKDIVTYINGRNYGSISITGSIKGMKKLYGWNTASEIVKSGQFYYAIW